MRALDSLRAQTNADARPIVIVNGGTADLALVEKLQRTAGLVVVRQAEAHMPRALAAGRRLVDTPFFAQLDDDDELLPDALEVRLARMMRADVPDAVVTNGLIRGNGVETPSIPDVDAVAREPMLTLMERNWMLPGSALFRTHSIDDRLFESTPRYLEWTYIGLLLASRYRLAFTASPTVIHYDDHAFSVNGSGDCAVGRPRAFDALLALDLPPAVKRLLQVKRGAAWHMAAETARTAGHDSAAWAAHLRSLIARGGWRYLTYTRHLLWRRDHAPASAAVPTTTHDR